MLGPEGHSHGICWCCPALTASASLCANDRKTWSWQWWSEGCEQSPVLHFVSCAKGIIAHRGIGGRLLHFCHKATVLQTLGRAAFISVCHMSLYKGGSGAFCKGESGTAFCMWPNSHCLANSWSRCPHLCVPQSSLHTVGLVAGFCIFPQQPPSCKDWVVLCLFRMPQASLHNVGLDIAFCICPDSHRLASNEACCPFDFVPQASLHNGASGTFCKGE